jgi:hypothetical protein
LAERFIRTAKNLLKKYKEDNTDIELTLLKMARITPAENLQSLAERLFKRNIRTPISCVEKQPVKLKNEKITAQIERNRIVRNTMPISTASDNQKSSVLEDWGESQSQDYFDTVAKESHKRTISFHVSVNYQIS